MVGVADDFGDFRGQRACAYDQCFFVEEPVLKNEIINQADQINKRDNQRGRINKNRTRHCKRAISVRTGGHDHAADADADRHINQGLRGSKDFKGVIEVKDVEQDCKNHAG